MAEKKLKNATVSIYGAAIEGVSPDCFEPPLNEEQLRLYYSVRELQERMDREGLKGYIDIVDDD